MSNSSINEKQLSNDDNLNDSEDDTITLTKIVDTKNSVSNVNILADIKQDLNLLKSTLIKHEQILTEILLKIK
jgi:hypothetical protein